MVANPPPLSSSVRCQWMVHPTFGTFLQEKSDAHLIGCSFGSSPTMSARGNHLSQIPTHRLPLPEPHIVTPDPAVRGYF